MKFYRWPCGMFKDIGGPWQVYLSRPMPCTPSGDLVGEFATQAAADLAADELNAASLSLDDARALYGARHPSAADPADER